jgi:STE24 endopeptidase
MNPAVLSLVFVVVLMASLVVKLWLATRQMRHVAEHRAAVPAAFASTVPLEAHQKAADYTMAKLRLGLVTDTAGTIILLGWTLLGGLDWLNATIRHAVAPHWGSIPYELALIGAFMLISSLLELPFEIWRIFSLEQRFGFNRMTPSLFAMDMAKSLLLGVGIGTPIFALILWLMHAAGGLWWLWAWGATSAYLFVYFVLKPVLFDRFFNRFDPLPDGPVVERSRALMQRCGFRAQGFYVMDGSTRSGHGNAYFTGFGKTKRVVFFDTLLEHLNADEIEAVLAHELGHFKHHDLPKGLVIQFIVMFLGFALLGWLAGQVGFYAGLNVMINPIASNDALALLLFLIVVPPFLYFVTPAFAAFSRRREFAADAYAKANASAVDLVRALVKLHTENKATLTFDPLFMRFYYSHPPTSARIAALGVAV